jgi:hypothetical protein
MTTYGYCKGYKYAGDGTLLVKVRIPSIHGPFKQTQAMGKIIRTYTSDANLPYYNSLLLPHLPNDGDVVAVMSLDSGLSNMIVIGLTGGSYYTGVTNLGE